MTSIDGITGTKPLLVDNVKPCGSVLEAARSLSAESKLPTKIASVLDLQARMISSSSTRALTDSERQVFTNNFNNGFLRVAYEDETLVMNDLRRIRNCEFLGEGNIIFQQQQQLSERADLFLSQTTFEDCLIETGAHAVKNTRVVRCILFANSSLTGCGLVSGPTSKDKTTSFGNGLTISPGLETGGRAVRIVAESTLEQLARVTLDQFRQVQDKRQYDLVVEHYRKQCTSEFTILLPFSRIENSPEVIACFLDRHCNISSGARARDSTLLEFSSVEQGSDVLNSLLQRKTHVSSQSIVRDSLICFEGSVEVHGKLLSSILGPGSHLAEGEISSSLIGPMVGFHHQSMLIATYWPSGRGNVGYGANCGSNHTSRVSDQSLWPGEGVFFGLGVSVKLPLNLSEAPYTVVATGVVYGPGRLAFPLSLVTSDSTGCRVAPGWAFASNAYAIERNSVKMKSRAPQGYASDILRSEIASQVWKARDVLVKCLQRDSEKKLFVDDFENGLHLGGGYSTREDMDKGVRAYSAFLELYALRTAVRAGIQSFPTSEAVTLSFQHDLASTGLLNEDTDTNVRKVLAHLFPNGVKVLEALSQREQQYATNVFDSKARDHVRGRKVFPEGRYDEAIPLDKDGVVRGAKERSQKLKMNGKL